MTYWLIFTECTFFVGEILDKAERKTDKQLLSSSLLFYLLIFILELKVGNCIRKLFRKWTNNFSQVLIEKWDNEGEGDSTFFLSLKVYVYDMWKSRCITRRPIGTNGRRWSQYCNSQHTDLEVTMKDRWDPL